MDNGSDPRAEAVAAGSGIPFTYLPSATNLGGAGGFAYGVLQARALGADWIWLADDDGRPADRWTLARLLVCARGPRARPVSPLVVDEQDPQQLAFPLRRGLVWVRRRSSWARARPVTGVANLFNGALLSDVAIEAVGVPDPRLFVRGDEVEMHRRLRRSGLPFGTCTDPPLPAPPGAGRLGSPVLAGRLWVLVPRDPQRQDRTYRNLGYLTAQPGCGGVGGPDAFRYAWYYLVQQRDPGGFAGGPS